MTRFDFAFSPAYRVAGLPFGVTPRTTWVQVDEDVLRMRFGPWSLRTTVGNVVSAQVTGDFAFVKTAGPAHLSFADGGVTFATNGDRALCLSFRSPVPGIDPTGLLARRLRHPGATVTVTDPEGLASALGIASR